MDKITTARFQREITEVLDRVASGESIMLTHFGRDVAILSPPVTNPALEPTDHLPSARHMSPLMKKIVRRRDGE